MKNSVPIYNKKINGTALTKDTFIIDVLNAEPEACWEGAHKDVEVKEEGHPGGGLVFRYWCYNGNVDLSIAVDNMEDKEKEDTTEKVWLNKGREKAVIFYVSIQSWIFFWCHSTLSSIAHFIPLYSNLTHWNQLLLLIVKLWDHIPSGMTIKFGWCQLSHLSWVHVKCMYTHVCVFVQGFKSFTAEAAIWQFS